MTRLKKDMPIAEFEEKQYEVPANIELGLQHAAVFAAGQVREAVVGYDVAAHPPQNAPIWRLVGGNAPPGLQLVPNLWQRAPVQPKAPGVAIHLRQPHLPVQEAEVFIDIPRVTVGPLGCAIFPLSDSSASARHAGDPGERTRVRATGSICLARRSGPIADCRAPQTESEVLDHSTFVPAELAPWSSSMDLQCSGNNRICEPQGRRDSHGALPGTLGQDQEA